MKTISETKKLILQTLKEKSCMKQDVFENATKNFELLKEVLNEIVEEYREVMDKIDRRIEIGFKSRSQYEAELRFAGDVLLFHMHTNVFDFDKSHSMWRTSYVQQGKYRSYCGMINVYNFLSDSLKYNRVNDSGYLVARIFINRENHFFVEGKKQVGAKFNDFVNSQIDKEQLRRIVQSTILYSLEFDLLTPPYDAMREIQVNDIEQIRSNMNLKTAKRLGFKFYSDKDKIE
jgi:hypothetical protein